MRYTFVIPVFATERYLPRCLDSIVAQTDGDFEAVVVDDCSPGNCREIVARYDERFRYVRQDRNRGSYQARARAIREARGDYIVAVDPDDYVLPGLLAELTAHAGGADVISYNLEMDTEGQIAPHWCHYEDETCGRDAVLEKLLARKMQWNLCGKAIRRDACLRALEGSHSTNAYVNASDDYALFLPVVMESSRFRFLGYSGYRYWQRPSSTTHASVSLCRLARSVVHTLRARRMVLRFLRGAPRSALAQTCAKELARRIVRWSVHEYVHNGIMASK